MFPVPITPILIAMLIVILLCQVSRELCYPSGRASGEQVVYALLELRLQLRERQCPNLGRKWFIGNGRCTPAIQQVYNLATVIHNVILGHQDPVLVRNCSFGLAGQNARNMDDGGLLWEKL